MLGYFQSRPYVRGSSRRALNLKWREELERHHGQCEVHRSLDLGTAEIHEYAQRLELALIWRCWSSTIERRKARLPASRNALGLNTQHQCASKWTQGLLQLRTAVATQSCGIEVIDQHARVRRTHFQHRQPKHSDSATQLLAQASLYHCQITRSLAHAYAPTPFSRTRSDRT